MKKTTIVVLALAIIILATPLASAVPLKEKNNDKFQAFSTIATFSITVKASADREYIPSFDNVNKFIVSYQENMLTYTITVGSNIYYLGTDFAHTGYAVETFFDPVFANPEKTRLVSWRAIEIVVDYTFDFSAYPGGIEGTLNMRGVFTQGIGFINSLSGTGDLQNVQVKEIGLGESFDPVYKIMTVEHAGLVNDWPE